MEKRKRGVKREGRKKVAKKGIKKAKSSKAKKLIAHTMVHKALTDKELVKLRKNLLKKEFRMNGKVKVEPVEYLKFGLKGFDELFFNGEGVPSGSAVLVEGGPGSGKTVFCLATMNALCKQGKKVLYMSFEEPERNLINHMRNFNWDVDSMVKKDVMRIKRFDAIDVSRSIEALLSAAKKELLIDVDPVFFPPDYKPDFVVIDSLTSIASAFSGQESRFRIYMEQLFRYLEKYRITSFLIREVSSPSHMGTTFKEEGEAVSFLSDGIIVLYNVIYDTGERGSALEILKMRSADFKKRIVEMKIIDGKGVEINSEKILRKDAMKPGFILT